MVDSTCTIFTSNGLANSSFSYYRFYDFRKVSGLSSTSTQNSTTAVKIVTDGTWTNDWYIRDYPRKSGGPPNIPVDFTPKRVSIVNSQDRSSSYSTYLTISTSRIDDETQEGGEITYKEFNVTYASIRVLGRVSGTPGACAGIFTYLNDTQESDIEMFTRDPPNFVHYSNQPASTGPPNWSAIPGATVNVSMPAGAQWTDWHIHRLDWTPGRSVFYVDGIERNTTTSQVPVPDPPSGIYLDMWGANSSWVGSMPIGGEATFDIQWVELLFNTSLDSPRAPIANQKICKVDAPQTGHSTSWALRLSAPSWTVIWSTMAVLIFNSEPLLQWISTI